MGNTKIFSAASLLLAGLTVQIASADRVGAEMMVSFDDAQVSSDFTMLDSPVAGKKGEPVVAAPSHLSSSGIAAVSGGTLVIDPDSGMLLLTDSEGKAKAKLLIGADAAQLVVDRKDQNAYVANRSGDSIAVVSYARGLRLLRTIKTRAEPYGLALTPDRKTLLVTTVADKELSAYDVATGNEKWSIDIGPEARSVAIAPSGKEAMVTFLNTSAVARVGLSGSTPSLRFASLDRSIPAPSSSSGFFGSPFQQNAMPQGNAGFFAGSMGTSTGGAPSADEGRRFSRAAFAVTYVGNDMAIVPHQESIPQLATSGGENTGVYGGGSRFERPIQHRLAFLSTKEGEFEKLAKAEIRLHQPRAMSYDAARDLLYVAGYGSDSIIALADASKPSIHLSFATALSNAADPCGPTSLTVADDGSVVAFCSLSRKLASVSQSKDAQVHLATSEALTTSRLSLAARRGRALFRMGDNSQISTSGVMACESCHPEGRQDGLSWRISGMALQTPLLAGKTVGTHPFKWDGGDKDLQTSLLHTVTRLGGSGINESQAKDIATFLTETKQVRTPTIASKEAVQRGQQLFTSKEVGCSSCHSGAMRTNGKTYELAEDLGKVDTPALVGLAASAPYYHDGSAATLRTLLLENGTIHGMGKLSHLNEQGVSDLIAYLETL